MYLTDVDPVTIESQVTSSPSFAGNRERISSGGSHPSHESTSNKNFQVPLEDRSMYEKFVDDFDGKRSSSSSSDSLSGNSDVAERVAINDSLLGYPETDQLLIPPCPGSVTGSSGGSRPDDDRDSIGSACDIINSEAGQNSDSDDHEDEIIAVIDSSQNDQLFVGHLEGSKHLLSDTDCCSDSDGESRRIAILSKGVPQLEMINLNANEKDLDAEVERNLLCQVIRDKDPAGPKQQDLFGSKPFTETSAKVAKTISSAPSGQDLFGAAPFSLLNTTPQITQAPVTVSVVQKSIVTPQIATSRTRELVPQQQIAVEADTNLVVRRKSSVETTSVSSLKGMQKKKETVKKKLKQDPKKKEITQSDEEEVDGLLNDDDEEDGTMMAASGLKSKDKKKGKCKEQKKEEKVKDKKKEEKKDKKEEKKKEEKKKDEKKDKKKDKKEEKKGSKRDKSRDPVQCSGFANLSFEDQTDEDRTSNRLTS